MAADSRNIVIELKVTGAGDIKENEAPTEEEQNAFDKRTTFMLAAKVASDAIQTITNVATYELNRSLNLTENYKAQVVYSNAMTAVNKATSFGAAIVSGAMFGAGVSGPYAGVGAAVGAAIAATTWTVNETINVYQRFDQAYLELSQMNLQSSYAMSRLGLTDNGRGTQN